MPNFLFEPASHLIKEWPEVFEDLYINTVPVYYLEIINLEFTDGRVWEIDIKTELITQTPDSIVEGLLNTLQEYHLDILEVNFKFDITKLKRDITDSSKDIL
jgi:hypothetical protein